MDTRQSVDDHLQGLTQDPLPQDGDPVPVAVLQPRGAAGQDKIGLSDAEIL